MISGLPISAVAVSAYRSPVPEGAIRASTRSQASLTSRTVIRASLEATTKGTPQ